MRLLKNKQVVQLSRAETRAEVRERCQKNFPVLLRIHAAPAENEQSPRKQYLNKHGSDVSIYILYEACRRGPRPHHTRVTDRSSFTCEHVLQTKGLHWVCQSHHDDDEVLLHPPER